MNSSIKGKKKLTMVVALGPGKFYGSGLPRPRFYTDVKFAPDRVDPPAPVMDPFLSWASEAHWSMGGLSFKRLRLQGRIEGNIKRLRAQHRRSDRINKKNNKKTEIRPVIAAHKIRNLDEEPEWQESSESEPELELEPEPERVVGPAKEGKAKLRKRARKLVDDFERVANADRVVYQTQSKKPGSDKAGEGQVKGAKTKGTPPRRTSPRKSVA